MPALPTQITHRHIQDVGHQQYLARGSTSRRSDPGVTVGPPNGRLVIEMAVSEVGQSFLAKDFGRTRINSLPFNEHLWEQNIYSHSSARVQ